MTLGEKLRMIRSDKRVSLGEVSRATRIQIAYLENIEEGNYDRLPPDVYVKGFLRSYAEFLGVDEQILIKLYDKEKGIKKNLAKSKNPELDKIKIEPINISSFVFTPKKMTVALVVLLALSGFFYLYQELGSFASTPRLVVLTPQANAEVDGNAVTVEGVTDKDARLFINEQPIMVNDDGKFRENITMQSGVNVINIKSVNKFQKETSESVTVRSKYNEQVAGDMTTNPGLADSEEDSKGRSAAQNEDLQMEVRVDPGPVWLSVETDDNLAFSGTMLSGAVQSFKAKDKILVNSGKGNATFVKFNSKDVGPLSQDPGAVRGIIFDKNTKF